jgi:hypothetical protein
VGLFLALLLTPFAHADEFQPDEITVFNGSSPHFAGQFDSGYQFAEQVLGPGDLTAMFAD